MSAGYILFLIVGRVLIFVGSKFVKQNEINIKFLNRLLSCSLCSGVWIYSILALLMGYSFDGIKYIPFVSEMIFGCFSSLVVFYIENGYKSVHEVIVVN